MSLRIAMLILSLSLLSACATTDNPQAHEQAQQPYMGNHPGQDDTDLYNANKNVQKPQSSAWGWMSNQ